MCLMFSDWIFDMVFIYIDVGAIVILRFLRLGSFSALVTQHSRII